jgi:hypothetical protein
VLALLGKKKFAAAQFVPKESMEKIKSDIDTLKADIGRATRSH